MAEGPTEGRTKGGVMEKTDESNLIVALRIRPMNEDEIIQGATPVAHKVDKNLVVLMDPFDPDDILRANRSREKQYVFDCAFDGSITQEEVYDHTTKVLIPNVIAGFNATVFAYGATGAGKTHTMLGSDDDPGIMARALNDLFLAMEQTSEDMAYSVTMSYLEIYNEMIRDLLNPSEGYLDLREDTKGVHIAGLSEVQARSTREVIDMLMKGNKERTQEPTAANKTSSRSHAILQVVVRQRNRMRNIMQEVRVGKLFLIDLAGSERAANTHNRGKRMVEGAHINRSLLALGNCINALSDKNGSKYVNFRDSKLTRLLKDALGGNCKTVMIAHISPASIHFEESRNTLLYADRAKQIRTKVRKNVMDVSYHIAQYTNIIAELREEIKRLRVKLDVEAGNKNASAIHAIQNEVLQAALNEDQSELNKLKDQLLSVFNNQMELRRSLMELNNTEMEISLDTTRNQLLIQKWERESALTAKKNKGYKSAEDLDDGEDKDRDTEKSKSEMDGEEMEEPEEVRMAREELKDLLRDKDKTDRLKGHVSKELEHAKEIAETIVEALPKKVSSAEQQEILTLLCKVHELEIENMEMQSSCLLRTFELRRGHMVIAKLRQHHNLCDEIIHQQRVLLEDQKTEIPRELEELYDLYQQELMERPASPEPLPDVQGNRKASIVTLNRKFLESESISEIEKLSTFDGDSSSLMGSRLLAPLSNNSNHSANKKPLLKKSSHSNLARLEEVNDNKMFSRSPKAQQLRDAAMREELMQNSSNSLTAAQAPSGQQRQQSIITLSSRSTATTPTPPVDSNKLESVPNHNTVVSKNFVKKASPDRRVIASNTRSIAALAAKRRTVKVDGQSVDATGHTSSYLTASRLAHHDRKYGGSNLTLNMLDNETNSTGTADQSLLQPDMTPTRLYNRGSTPSRGYAPRPRYRAVKKQPSVRNSKRRTKPQDQVNYQQMSPEAFFRQLNRASVSHRRPQDQTSMSSFADVRSNTDRRRSLLPQPGMGARGKRNQSTVTTAADEDDDVKFDPPPTPPQTVQQMAPEKGRGLTLQKRVRGPASDTSTPVQTSRSRLDGKRAPSIPHYGRANFGITGHSVSKL